MKETLSVKVRIVVARKEHRCLWCGEPITVRTRYFAASGQYMGDWQDWRMHFDCLRDAAVTTPTDSPYCESGQHNPGQQCSECGHIRPATSPEPAP